MKVKRNALQSPAHVLKPDGSTSCGAKLRASAEVKMHWTVRPEGRCKHFNCAKHWAGVRG